MRTSVIDPNTMNRNDAIRVLLACTVLSALTCWLLVIAEGGMNGGRPVSMTLVGHGFFILVGGLLGVYIGAIVGGIYSGVRSRLQTPIRQLSHVEWIFIPLLVSIASVCVLMSLMMLLVTIPDDVFRILFDVPGARD